MTRYEVYYRKVNDGRAPERVHLSDEYTRGPTVIAENIRNLEHQLAQMTHSEARIAGVTRKIQVGDVVLDKSSVKRVRIYTATGAWADVQLV